MRMDDIRFKDEKEAWQRYNIRNPPSTPIMRLEMMKRSMNAELLSIMSDNINALKGNLEREDVEKFLTAIEDNAVIKTPKSKHLAALEAITQGAGERMMPYLSRIRSAAARIQLTMHGACTKETHPNLKAGESTDPATGGPSTTVEWPCTEGANWARMLTQSRNGGRAENQGGPIADSNRNCPACCKSRPNEEMKDWLIKKQFHTKLHNETLKEQLDMQLGTKWAEAFDRQEEFDPYKFQISSLLQMAEALENSITRKSVDSGGVTTSKPRGGGRDRGRGRGGTEPSQRSNREKNRGKRKRGQEPQNKPTS
jgi:hypothetical protein